MSDRASEIAAAIQAIDDCKRLEPFLVTVWERLEKSDNPKEFQRLVFGSVCGAYLAACGSFEQMSTVLALITVTETRGSVNIEDMLAPQQLEYYRECLKSFPLDTGE